MIVTGGSSNNRQLLNLNLRSSNGPGAPLATRLGKIVLFLGQICEAEERSANRFVLHTTKYRYALAEHSEAEAFVRWEYEKSPQGPELSGERCRHHMQGSLTVSFRDQKHCLNDWHLPTGYVPLEEVIRFCIVDLGVKPISTDWSNVLQQSYENFRDNLRCPGVEECPYPDVWRGDSV